MATTTKANLEGILPIIKPRDKSSFYLVSLLRRLTGVRKIGHAGTLDPFAEGVMVLLIGRNYTRLSDRYLNSSKEYTGKIFLGKATDTYDSEGCVIASSEKVPTLEEIEKCLEKFQGTIEQVPPMFSAKKINGQKLYQLARRGIEIERDPVSVSVETTLLSYSYPYLELSFKVSKGTYIRSIAHDIGKELGTHAYLEELTRTRSGTFSLSDCVTVSEILSPEFSFKEALAK